jgi:hypothetical protein
MIKNTHVFFLYTKTTAILLKFSKKLTSYYNLRIFVSKL